MTDNELLKAISDIIQTQMQPLKNDVQEVHADVQSSRADMRKIQEEVKSFNTDLQVFKAELQSFKTELQNFKAELQNFKSELKVVKEDVHNLKENVQKLDQCMTILEMMVENVTNKNIQRVAEGHLDLNRKLDEALRLDAEREMIALRINVLEGDVKMLKEKIGMKDLTA